MSGPDLVREKMSACVHLIVRIHFGILYLKDFIVSALPILVYKISYGNF